MLTSKVLNRAYIYIYYIALCIVPSWALAIDPFLGLALQALYQILGSLLARPRHKEVDDAEKVNTASTLMWAMGANLSYLLAI